VPPLMRKRLAIALSSASLHIAHPKPATAAHGSSPTTYSGLRLTTTSLASRWPFRCRLLLRSLS
jgi:hypothetical protein